MNPDQVTFRLHDGIDVCEIRLPDSNVGVFPANEAIPGSDPAQTYAERYRDAFEAYKGGGVKPPTPWTAEAQAKAKKTAKRNAKPAKKAPAKKAGKAKSKVGGRNIPFGERTKAKK